MKKDPNCDFGSIVAGSIGYLEAEFQTTSDWSNCTLIAYFTGDGKEEYMPVINGKCDIPSEVLGGVSFTVQLVGTRDADYKVISTRETILQKVQKVR